MEIRNRAELTALYEKPQEGIKAFAEGFTKRFEADALEVQAMFQTRSGGRKPQDML